MQASTASVCRAAGLALLGLLVAVPASALVIGDFEGALDGWSTTGAASSRGAIFGIAPTLGGGMLQLTTGGASTPDDGSFDAFFGFASGTVEALSPSGNAVSEGSGATLVVNANAGDVLSYDYDFVTRETLADAPTYRDFFFTTIRSNEEGEVVREDVLSMLRLPSTNPNQFQSGWQSLQYTFLTSGTFTIGFGVADVQDTAVTSRVLIDNIQIVPEPSAGILLGVGLLAIGLRGRVRRGA